MRERKRERERERDRGPSWTGHNSLLQICTNSGRASHMHPLVTLPLKASKALLSTTARRVRCCTCDTFPCFVTCPSQLGWCSRFTLRSVFLVWPQSRSWSRSGPRLMRKSYNHKTRVARMSSPTILSALQRTRARSNQRTSYVVARK